MTRRDKPANVREMMRGLSQREASERYGFPASTLGRWLAAEIRERGPLPPRVWYEGYGHGAPVWRTEPSSCWPRGWHRVERESGRRHQNVRGAVLDRRRDERSFAGPVRPGDRAPYTRTEVRAVQSQGSRAPRSLSIGEALVVNENKRDRDRQRSMETWEHLGCGSAPGWSIGSARPTGDQADATYDGEHWEGAAILYRRVYQMELTTAREHTKRSGEIVMMRTPEREAHRLATEAVRDHRHLLEPGSPLAGLWSAA